MHSLDACLGGPTDSTLRRRTPTTGAPPMRIDAYTHFFPKKFFDRMMEIAGDYKDMGKRMRGVPALYDLDHRMKIVDMFPDYAQILSYPQPPLENFANPNQIDDLAKLINDRFAAICPKHPRQFP